jgi:exoribonuclease R
MGCCVCTLGWENKGEWSGRQQRSTPAGRRATSVSLGPSRRSLCPPTPSSNEQTTDAKHPRQVAPEEALADDDGAAAGKAAGRRPTGRVVGVLKRNWRQRGYCGSLKPEEGLAGGATASVLFVPVERRFPMIRWVHVGCT